MDSAFMREVKCAVAVLKDGILGHWTHITTTVKNLFLFFCKGTTVISSAGSLQKNVGDLRRGPSCSLHVHFHRQAMTHPKTITSLFT